MAEFPDSISQREPQAFEQAFEFDLSAADAAALDALIDGRPDLDLPGALPPPLTGRGAKVSSLLALLSTPAPGETRDSDTLTDITLARIDRAIAKAAEQEEFELCEDDAEAFDALVTAGYDLARVPSVLRQRATRISDLLALSGTPWPATDTYAQREGEDLASRTMANIPLRLRPRERFGFAGGGLRIADLVSVAAVLLIAASVVWPLLATIRTHQRQAACGSNYASLSTAMGSYAGDYRDHFPMAAASLGGPTWWDVGAGPGKSNSANLYQLPKLQYASLSTLACPNNSQAPRGQCSQTSSDWSCLSAVSYSYQIMFGQDRPTWNQGQPVVILADASPVTRRAARGEMIFPDQNSQNHDGRGQWVLFSDGAGQWLNTPYVGSDNIWMPAMYDLVARKAQARIQNGETRGIIEIRGNELPSSAQDSFLGP